MSFQNSTVRAQKRHLLVGCFIAWSLVSPLYAAEGLDANPLLKRGGIDVVDRSVGGFSIDVGIGFSGLGTDETNLALSLTPRYQVWRRGDLGLDIALPIIFVPDPKPSTTDGDLFLPGVEYIETQPTIEVATSIEVAASVELDLPTFTLGTRCCFQPSIFLGAGFQFNSGPTVDFGEGGQFRAEDMQSPLVTAGAAWNVRETRRISTRFELRATTVYEEDSRIETFSGVFKTEGQDITTWHLMIGIGFNF